MWHPDNLQNELQWKTLEIWKWKNNQHLILLFHFKHQFHFRSLLSISYSKCFISIYLIQQWYSLTLHSVPFYWSYLKARITIMQAMQTHFPITVNMLTVNTLTAYKVSYTLCWLNNLYSLKHKRMKSQSFSTTLVVLWKSTIDVESLLRVESLFVQADRDFHVCCKI